MLRVNDEFVLARLRRLHRAFPANGKLIRLERPGGRGAGSEVEMHFGINAIDDALVPLETAGREVFAAEPVAIVEPGRGTKCSDQVRDCVAILFDCEPSEFDPRRLVALARATE